MGFSAPYGLASLLFALALVVLHLRRRQQREIEVSSLLLWQEVRDEPPRGRFRPNVLFLLQLALLGALGVSIARPYWVERVPVSNAGRAVVVLDVSASMQAREGRERRFDQARRRVEQVLSALDRDVQVMMIAAAARPRVVLAFTQDRGAIARALEGIEPEDGPTHLSLAIQFAQSMAAGTRGPLEIDVFTDLPKTDPFTAARGERLRYFRFGQSDDNVAVASLRVYQSPFQESGDARGYAVIKNYANAPKQVDLHVTLGSDRVLDDKLSLAPLESRAVSLGKLSQPGRLEARLDADDALAVDNRALAYVQPTRKIRVVAVSPSAGMLADLRAIARSVPAVDLRAVSPAQYQRDQLAGADVAVFHQFAPDEHPAVNSLYVHPPGSAEFPSSREVSSAQILDWNESDPVLRDLRYLDALAFDRARLITLPSWAHTLLTSKAEGKEFPLAFAGETEGHRVICFAFDLGGRSLVRGENLSLLLLTLNSLRWLTPADPESPRQVDVGDEFHEPLAQPAAYTVTDPAGHVASRPKSSQVSFPLERAGEYRVSVDGVRRTIFANLFDAEESNIGRPPGPPEEVVEGEAAEATGVSVTTFHEFASSLLFFGWVFALLEWAYWAFRESRRREQADVG